MADAEAQEPKVEATEAAEPPAAPVAGAEEVAAEESTAYFEPVVKLEEVEVENGEEEEEVTFKMYVCLQITYSRTRACANLM